MTATTVLTLGDVAVDVIVEAEVIALDDDRDAPIELHVGGQAANVARWVSILGRRSGLLTQDLGDDVASRFAREVLDREGVDVLPAFDEAQVPVICSFVADGRRTLLSDDGGVDYRSRTTWEDLVSDRPGWLHVSGYALARCRDIGSLMRLLQGAVSHGWQVTVDLSAISVVERLGGSTVVDLIEEIAVTAVFGNDAEWAALGPAADRVVAARIIKHGADGCTFVPGSAEGGGSLHLDAVPTNVIDPTGAGDALAAGWLVGGPPLAMATAARCLAVRGGVPIQTDDKRRNESR